MVGHDTVWRWGRIAGDLSCNTGICATAPAVSRGWGMRSKLQFRLAHAQCGAVVGIDNLPLLASCAQVRGSPMIGLQLYDPPFPPRKHNNIPREALPMPGC